MLQDVIMFLRSQNRLWGLWYKKLPRATINYEKTDCDSRGAECRLQHGCYAAGMIEFDYAL